MDIPVKKRLLNSIIFISLSSNVCAGELEFDFYGEAGIGGQVKLQGEDKGKYLDGSYLDLALGFEHGKFFGLVYLEGWTVPARQSDGEAWEYGHGIRGWEGGFNRVYVGYRFHDDLEITMGRMDSALDEYDDYGDYTVEYAMTPAEAGDVNFGIKLSDRNGDFRYGISIAPESNYNASKRLFKTGKYNEYANQFEKSALINGYAEYRFEHINLMSGAELTDGDGNIFMMGAKLFGHFSIKGWHDTKKGEQGQEQGFVVSSVIEPLEGLYLSAGYNFANTDLDGEEKYVNAGLWYEYGTDKQYAFAIDTYLPDEGDSKVFFKQFFYF